MLLWAKLTWSDNEKLLFKGKTSQETHDDDEEEEEDDNNSSNDETSDSDEVMQVATIASNVFVMTERSEWHCT